MDRKAWDERYGGTELVWTAEPNRFLVEEATGLPVGAALDVAAGEGRNAVWLAEQGWRATAVDFSPVGLEKGRRLAERRAVEVEWVVADVVEWEPPAMAFDLVVVLYLHLPGGDLATVLARSAAAVAPGGTLFAVGHDVTNLTEGVGGPQDPSLLWTPDAITAPVERAGLVIERAGRVRRPVEIEAATVEAIDCLVRAGRPR